MKRTALQKLMALVLTVVLLAGSMATVSADTTSASAVEATNQHIKDTSKVVSAEKVAIDEWEITLKFTPTEVIEKTAKPVDVALVIDTSGSMNLNGNDRLSVAKAAISDFVNSIPATADVRISLTKFNSEATGSFTGTKTVQGLTDNYEDVLTAAEALKAGGGTNTEKGLLVGGNTFEEGNTERQEIMIIISDGLPTHYLAEDGVTELGNGDNTTSAEKNAAIAAADQIKEDGVEIYSVGLDINAQLLKDIAGDNDPETDDAAYYRTISSNSTTITLGDYFEDISKSLGGEGLTDEMGPNVDLVENSAKMVIKAGTPDEKEDGILSVDDEGTISWTPDEKLGTETRTLTYRVKIDPTLGAGAYVDQATNGTTQYDYIIGETSYFQPFVSPTVNFNIAEAEVATVGLPEGIESPAKIYPNMHSEEGDRIITGYKGDDIDDTFSVYAPVVEHDGVTYKPTVMYALTQGEGVDGLEIKQEGDVYSITSEDLKAGMYRFTVTYKAEPFQVIFEENGGSDVEDKAIDKGNLVPTDGTNTEREGFDFTGWYTDEELTIPWDFENNKVEKNTILYAGWEPKEATEGTDGGTTGGTTGSTGGGTTSGGTTPPTNPLAEVLPAPVATIVGAIAPIPAAAVGVVAETTDSAVINEVEVPLASEEASWSLLDLILTVATGIMSIMLLVTYLAGRREDEEYREHGEEIKRKGLVRVLSALPMIGAIILFVLTQDMTLPMAIVDEWTMVFAGVALVQAGLMLLSRKRVEEVEEYEMTQATV